MHHQEVEAKEAADYQHAADRHDDLVDERRGLCVRRFGRLDALGTELGLLALAFFAFELGIDLGVGTGDSRHASSNVPVKLPLFWLSCQ